MSDQLQSDIKAQAQKLLRTAQDCALVIAALGVRWSEATDQEIFAIAGDDDGAIAEIRHIEQAIEYQLIGVRNMVEIAELRRDDIRVRMREKCIKA